MARNTAILSVRIVGDGSSASRAFRRVERDAQRWQSRMNRMQAIQFSRTIGGWSKALGNLSLAFGAVGYAMPFVIAGFKALTAAGVGFVAFAAAGFAAVKLGMEGVRRAAGEASSGMRLLHEVAARGIEGAMVPGFRKFNELMHSMAPNMENLARAMGSSFSTMATIITDTGGSAIRGILDNTANFVTGIAPGLANLLVGILNFAKTATDVLTNWAPNINQWLTDMGAKLSGISAQTLVDSFQKVGQVIEEVRTIFGYIQPVVDKMVQHSTLLFQMAVALKSVQLALALVTAAQVAWNLALLMSPLTWVILAIVAVVAIVVVLAMKFQWMRDIWSAVGSAIAAGWNWLMGVIRGVIDWIVGIWPSVTAAATTAWNTISSVASTVWNAISSVVSTVIGIITAVISTGIGIASGVFRTLQGTASGVFGVIKGIISGVSNAISTVVGWVRTLIGWLGKLKFPSPPGWLSGLFGASMGPDFTGITPMSGLLRFLPEAPFAMAAPAPALTAAAPSNLGFLGRGSAPMANVTNIQIDIHGALDPVAVGRQVRDSLQSLARTTGTEVAVRL